MYVIPRLFKSNTMISLNFNKPGRMFHVKTMILDMHQKSNHLIKLKNDKTVVNVLYVVFFSRLNS